MVVKKHTFFALTAYLLLTVLMTWPVARHLAGAIPGDGFDGWQNYWNLWWVKESLLVLGVNPFFTPYLYPPTGVSLLFHTLNIFNGLWTLPIQLNGGLALAYNSVVFFSFTLAGYGGYLLSLHTLTRLRLPPGRPLRLAAFVGGLVFTMSPFHMAHLLGHMQVFSIVWLPFYMLYLLRALEPWTGPGAVRFRRGNAALACLFLVLVTLVDWYHTLYMLMFTGLVLLWATGRQWKRGHGAALLRPVGVVLAIGVGFGLVLWPLLGPMVRHASSRPDLETGLAQNIALSADLLAFVTPSEMHPWWGEWAGHIAQNFSSTLSERLIFAGFVPLVLALFMVVRWWSSPPVRFWGMTTVFFFGLALGPYLHLGGQIVTVGGWPVPLPYLLLYHTVPFIGLTRSLSRYDLVVMLGLGVLVAGGLAVLAKGRRYWLPLAAGLLVCVEFLAVPYPVSKVEIPPFYEQIAADPESYTIAELPMDWDRPTPLLHQTVHGKPLLTAYTSRNNPRELAWRTPVLQHWRYLAPDIIDQPLARIAPTIFYDFNLRYIVLDYWQMPPGPTREATERWVAEALPGASPVYEDGRLKVYQAPPRREIRPYLSLGQGWSGRQEHPTGPVTRTFEQPAELFLHHPQGQPLRLEIAAAAPTAHRLVVLAGGEPVGGLELSAAFGTGVVRLPAFEQDIVKLTLRSEGPVVVRRVGLR